MFNQTVIAPEQFPVLEKNRKSTDVICTVIGALFALVLFVFAIIYFNNNNVNNTFFNNLSTPDGTSCGALLLQYQTPNDASTRSCVAVCDSGFTNQNGICWPQDPALQAKYQINPDITLAGDYNGFKKTLFWTAIAALSLGLIWITLVSLLPRYTPIIVVVLNILLLIALGIFVLISTTGFFANNQILKIAIAAVLFLLAIIFIVIGLVYSNELRLQGIFLDYANHFLYDNPLNYLYILLFLIFTAGLVALFLFQHASFAAKTGNSHNFFNFAAPGVWGILNIIEFIWGLQFLRDAFNFIVAGNAVDWYWGNNLNNSSLQSSHSTHSSGSYFCGSFSRLICKNWGSVVGGSFLNGFFQIPTLIAELLICHPNTCCSKFGTFCTNSCNWFGSIFNLVRTDAYSYINISGTPYCNSARECAKLCGDSRQFVGSFSPIKHYRFNAHVFLVALIVLIGYLITKVRVVNIGFWNAVVLVVVSYLVITWFIDIHADAAEGIQTSFLAEHYASQGYQFMQRAYPSFRKQIEHRSNRANAIRDGNC